MKAKDAEALLRKLSLQGLRQAPPQRLGGIRLIPLLRDQVRPDLRLGRRRYKDALAVVSTDSQIDEPGEKYLAYVPHGLVVSWSDDGMPVTAYGTHMAEEERDTGGARPRDGRRFAPFGKDFPTVRLMHRMVRREADRRLRFLPLHLAMEGFLALHFGGPDIAWSEYSKQFLRHGLDPRMETAVPGRALPQLEDALRLFEIHDDQCGVLLYVADALASVFVVPHPADYRLLHQSLIEDFFGDLVAQYAQQYRSVMDFSFEASPARPRTLTELRAAFGAAQQGWRNLGEQLEGRLLGCEVRSERVYRAGSFVLQRFVTSLRLDEDNHIGEAIVRDGGEVMYLKTFRLSAAQAKRAYLLQLLATHHWILDAAAASIGATRAQLVARLVSAGFGYLLSEPVLRAARKQS